MTASPSEHKSHLRFTGWALGVLSPHPTRGGSAQGEPPTQSERLLLLTPLAQLTSVRLTPVSVPHPPNSPAGTIDEKMESRRCPGTCPQSHGLERAEWKPSPGLLKPQPGSLLCPAALLCILKQHLQEAAGKKARFEAQPFVLQELGFSGTSLYFSESFIVIYRGGEPSTLCGGVGNLHMTFR